MIKWQWCLLCIGAIQVIEVATPKLCLTEQRRLDNHRGVRIRVSVRPLLMLDTGKNSHTELHSIIQYH